MAEHEGAEKGLPLLCRLRGHGRWRKRAYWPGKVRTYCHRCSPIASAETAERSSDE